MMIDATQLAASTGSICQRLLQYAGSVFETTMCYNGLRHEAASEIAALTARVVELGGALRWYGEHARLCRLIHSEGDVSQHALNDDGGQRARAAIGAIT